MILQTLIFIIFVIFFFILPSNIIFKILKIDEKDPFSSGALHLILGITFFTIFIFIIRILGLGFIYIWFLPLISLLYLTVKRKLLHTSQAFINIKYLFTNKIILLVILIGVITQNIVLFRGGWEVKGGFYYPSLHDTMWNIALANELYYHFPPQHPGLSGYLLKNNHYFYPLLLSGIRFITQISIIDLYFRFGPILISLAFGLSLYIISTIFTKNPLFRALIVFLGFFSGNIAYILPLFLGRNFNWQGNTFFADQPFDQIINPYTVLGFALMLIAIYALFKATANENKIHIGWGLLCGFIVGVIYGFKSFGGIIVVISIVFISSFYILKYKKKDFLIIPLTSGFFFIPIFLFTTEPFRAALSFYPGWILTQMISDQDKLNMPSLVKIEDYYKAIHNTLGFFKIRILELLVYIFGNLGVRILGLVYSVKIVFFGPSKHKQYWLVNLFIFCCAITGLIIPLLFNLRFSTFNIIQFTPYALVLLAIVTGAFTEKIYIYTVKRKKQLIGLIFILFVLLFSIPVNIKNILSKIHLSHNYLSYGEVEALNYLRDNTSIDSVILINPMQFKDDPIYVPALTERRVYLASPNYAEQVGINPSERIASIKNFFDKPNSYFLTQNKISYIYLLKNNTYTYLSGFSKVFENNDVLVLSTKKT